MRIFLRRSSLVSRCLTVKYSRVKLRAFALLLLAAACTSEMDPPVEPPPPPPPDGGVTGPDSGPACPEGQELTEFGCTAILPGECAPGTAALLGSHDCSPV